MRTGALVILLICVLGLTAGQSAYAQNANMDHAKERVLISGPDAVFVSGERTGEETRPAFVGADIQTASAQPKDGQTASEDRIVFEGPEPQRVRRKSADARPEQK